MRKRMLLTVFLLSLSACSGPSSSDAVDVLGELDKYDRMPGFFDLY